jgi:hypothetical protein
MLRWLRTFGSVGGAVAATITIIETKLTWGLVVSVALGAATWIWAGLFDFFNNPHTQIAVGVFLGTLWTYIGLRALLSFNKPVQMSPQPDYRYCISPEGYQLFIDPEGIDLAISVGFQFRNVGNWPVRFRVEQFKLMIEDRICQEPDEKIEMIIQRIGARGIRSGGFKKDVVKDRNTGLLDVIVIYGDPEGPFVRRYQFKTKLHFRFQEDLKGIITGGALSEESFSEKDSPI